MDISQAAKSHYAKLKQSDKDGQFYFSIHDRGNNESVLDSEGYEREGSARERIQELFPGIEIREA